MAVDVKVPSVGESVQEGMIHKWHKNSGDYVELDEVIVELETDKATVEVVAEAAGVVKTLKEEGDTVNVGDVIANIDTDAQKPAGGASDSAPKKESQDEAKAEPSSQPQQASAPAQEPSTPAPSAPAAGGGGNSHLSPAVARMVAEHGLDSRQIAASGPRGNITKGDVIQHMEGGGAATAAATAAQPKLREVPQQQTAQKPTGERVERRENMSMLRRRIAERLVEAQQTAAILTTFNEIDMSAVMALRKQYKESFKEEHGVGLGFMSFFVKASISALKAFPAINGWIEGKEIVYHDYYDIGVAVSSPRGLVVPVVRDADKLSMAGVEKAIGDYAVKARDGKITVDDITGGTFTISNGGVFGSLLSTPILNPPQSAILGMHKIEQRAVVVDGQVVVRPMMYLALSYDHRIVDGKEAVQFLVKIKENVEDPHRLLLGV